MQKYIDNTKEIAKTGADGLWMDVPVYFDTMVKWNDHSVWGAAAFKTDTGLTIPSVKNWDDPVCSLLLFTLLLFLLMIIIGVEEMGILEARQYFALHPRCCKGSENSESQLSIHY